VGGLGEPDTLDAVLADAHTVCHLVGRFELPTEADYLQVNLGSVERILEASRRTGVRRVLFLSYPGARPSAPNAFLRGKGAAEEAIRASGLDHVILRCTRVFGPGHEWLRFGAWARSSKRPVAYVVGSGRQIVAPIHVQDVAALLAAADDRDRLISGTWALEGPDRVTADELTDLLAGRRVPKVHLTRSWRWGLHRRRLGGPPAKVADELWAADSLADAADAAAEFGIARTPLADGLARSLESTGDPFTDPG
jgi:NADH dehydrogenase